MKKVKVIGPGTPPIHPNVTTRAAAHKAGAGAKPGPIRRQSDLLNAGASLGKPGAGPYRDSNGKGGKGQKK